MVRESESKTIEGQAERVDHLTPIHGQKAHDVAAVNNDLECTRGKRSRTAMDMSGTGDENSL